MHPTAVQILRALALSLLVSACASTGPRGHLQELAGTVHLGRWLHPEGAFSIRLPAGADLGPIADHVEDGHGQLALPSTWEGPVGFQWSDGVSPYLPTATAAGEAPYPLDGPRARLRESLRQASPDLEFVHDERLVFEGAPAHLFVARLPRGSNVVRVKFGIFRERLDAYVVHLLTVRDGTTWLVYIARSEPWSGDGDWRTSLEQWREQVLEHAARISFDDPLLDEL